MGTGEGEINGMVVGNLFSSSGYAGVCPVYPTGAPVEARMTSRSAGWGSVIPEPLAPGQ